MSPFARTVLSAVVGLGCAVPAWADKPADKPKPKVEFRRAETKPAEGLTEATVAGTTEKVYLHKTADLTAEDIAGAKVVSDDAKNPEVEITFTKEGGKKMAKLTADHQGKPLAVLLDGKVLTAPVIRATISERAAITGKFTNEEAEKLVQALTGK